MFVTLYTFQRKQLLVVVVVAVAVMVMLLLFLLFKGVNNVKV
jgi:hypothetical protein